MKRLGIGIERRGGRAGVALFVGLLGVGLCSAPAGAADDATTAPKVGDEVIAAIESGPPLVVDAADLLAYATARPAPPNVPAEILLDDIRYTFAPDGRHVTEFHRIFRLLREDGGDKWRSIYAGYSPWLDQTPVIRARVIAPDGSERFLDPKALLDGPEASGAPDVVSDRRRVLAPLPPLEVGSVVEEVIRVADKRLYFAAGSAQRVSLSRDVPTRLARLTLVTPDALPLKTRIDGFPSALAVTKTPSEAPVRISIDDDDRGNTVRVWELRDLEATPPREPAAPPNRPRGATVSFSTGRAWNAIASAYAAIVDEKIAGAEIRGLINGVSRVTATTSERDRLEAATEVLERVRLVIRYTGVELGAAAVIPYTPAETLARGFGDCKDQAAVLVAALRSLGFNANVALLALSPLPDVSTDLPGLGLFNHAVVHVAATKSAPAFWIDSTRPLHDVGVLPLEAQGRRALVAAHTTTSLVMTPQSTAAENTYSETRTIALSDHGPAQASEVTRATGSLRTTLRGFFEGKTDAALLSKFSEYAALEYGAQAVVSIDRPPVRSVHDPFLLQIEMEQAERFAVDDDGGEFKLSPRMAWSFLPDSLQPVRGPRERTQPFHFDEPQRVEIVYRLVLPVGFDWEASPPPFLERVHDATFERRVTLLADGSLEVAFRIETGNADLTPAQVTDFQRALERFALQGPATLKLRHRGKQAIAEGQVADGIGVYRALIERNPKKARPHERLADVLLEMGLGHAARLHAQRAVDLEPNAPDAWATLGWVLLHDELGRKLDPGFDRTGAIAALRQAIRLRPGDAQLQANLAVALEHGDGGTAFGLGADVPGAILAYEQRRLLTGERDYDVNLLRAYFRSKRFADIVALAPKVKRSAATDSLYLGAVAALEGPEQALERAKWLIEVPAIRRQAIEVAADVLPLVGKYQEAAVLLRAAVRGSRDPARLLSRAKILDAAKGHETCVLHHDDVVRRRVDAWYRALYRESDDATLDAMIEEDAQQNPSALQSVRLEAERADRLLATLSRRALPPRVLLDAALCGTRMDVQDSRASVVVTVRPLAVEHGAMFPAPSHQWVFAKEKRKEGDRLRLVALVGDDRDPSPSSDFAYEALRQSRAGRQAAAREWLDHALATFRDDFRDDDEGPRDVLAAPPFVRVWGTASDKDRGAAAFVATAAALLIVGGPTPGDSLPALRSARAKLTTTSPKWLRFAVLEGLTRAALGAEDWPLAVEQSAALVALKPASLVAYALHNEALWGANDLDTLRARAEERLDVDHMRDLAALTLSSVELAQGEFDAADARLRHLGQADAFFRSRSFNHLAWSALFHTKDPRELETALDDALTATRAQKRPSSESLQTLAAVYAALDRPKDAVSTLSRAVDARTSRTLIRDDYFVLGRVAESYGLRDAARKAYERMRPVGEETVDAFDAWHLAAPRLAALDATQAQVGPLEPLASPTERSLLDEIERLRQASDAATARSAR